MSLDQLHAQLGWPTRDEILRPTGAGARIFVQLAAEKVGKAIARLPDGEGVEVGVLASNPDATEAPIALVCEFPRPVSPLTLLETQKLAWNFCRTLLLITIEPHLIRKWTCCEKPIRYEDVVIRHDPGVLPFEDELLPDADTPEILPRIPLAPLSGRCLDVHAAESLQWIELISGNFFKREAKRFRQEQRADRMLLSNLKEVRSRLRGMNLEDRYSHDLLARIIFVQFLFDRKDSTDRAALNPGKLSELYRKGVLSAAYSSLGDILADYDDAYRLFRWLNERFNGDLFPGKGGTPEEREAEWQAEQAQVTPEHLKLLAEFVRGDLEMQSGQFCLWPQYAFDAIPLEFISSVYEEFVSGEEGVGVHYTRDFLVDLMLDRVLPWQGEEWDLRILDPACGSGIFLVKSYQRLIHRWKYAHRNTNEEISPAVLRGLLEHNLFGVDADPNAVRVASFSLYLAMCDEIDPRHYWSDERRVQFPVLRGVRIINSDFFAEDQRGLRTEEDAESFDLVVGNPPWGDATLTKPAEEWARENGWPIANRDFGTLFIAKSMALTKPSGRVCLVQSASALLYNREETATALRRRLFLEFKQVEAVINLAAFRLFKDVRVPTCVITFRNQEPNGDFFWYECPKPLRTSEDINRILIEPQDVHRVYPFEVCDEPWLWSTLMWGGNRDRSFIRRLSRYSSLEKLRAEQVVKTRQGVIQGDRGKTQDELVGRPFLSVDAFEHGPTLRLVAKQLPPIEDPRIHSRDSSGLEAFDLPQLVLKTSWVKRKFRFQAKLVDAEPELGGVICSRSFVSVHMEPDQEELLKAACIIYNSSLANYYLLLTSGRFAFDRSEPLIEELRDVPLPNVAGRKLPSLNQLNTVAQIDRAAYALFQFKDAETILIEDLVHYTLPDYKGQSDSPGRQPTRRDSRVGNRREDEPELSQYCEVFRRVMMAAYGRDKLVGTIVFNEGGSAKLPVRMVSVYLNSSNVSGSHVVAIDPSQLRDRLTQFYRQVFDRKDHFSFYHRCSRSYETVDEEGQVVLVINIVKPDQVRYWTRSMAMRDADDVTADLMLWSQALADTSRRVQGGVCE